MEILYTLNKHPDLRQLQLFTETGGKILLLENAVNWLITPYAKLFINHIPNLSLYKFYVIQDDLSARNIICDQIWQVNNIIINYISYSAFVDLVVEANKIINI